MFWEAIESTNPVFRFGATIIFIMFCTGYCIEVFRKHDINYYIIFELSPNHRMEESQFYALGCTLLFLWMAAFYVEINLQLYRLEEKLEQYDDIAANLERLN